MTFTDTLHFLKNIGISEEEDFNILIYDFLLYLKTIKKIEETTINALIGKLHNKSIAFRFSTEGDEWVLENEKLVQDINTITIAFRSSDKDSNLLEGFSQSLTGHMPNLTINHTPLVYKSTGKKAGEELTLEIPLPEWKEMFKDFVLNSLLSTTNHPLSLMNSQLPELLEIQVKNKTFTEYTTKKLQATKEAEEKYVPSNPTQALNLLKDPHKVKIICLIIDTLCDYNQNRKAHKSNYYGWFKCGFSKDEKTEAADALIARFKAILFQQPTFPLTQTKIDASLQPRSDLKNIMTKATKLLGYTDPKEVFNLFGSQESHRFGKDAIPLIRLSGF